MFVAILAAIAIFFYQETTKDIVSKLQNRVDSIIAVLAKDDKAKDKEQKKTAEANKTEPSGATQAPAANSESTVKAELNASKSFVLPANRAPSYIPPPILFFLAFVVAVIGAGVAYFVKKQKEDEKFLEKVRALAEDVAKNKKEFTPRALNILFNKIVFLTYIGDRKLLENYKMPDRAFEYLFWIFYSYVVAGYLWLKLKDRKKAENLAFGASTNSERKEENFKIVSEYLKGEREDLGVLKECIDLSEYVVKKEPSKLVYAPFGV